MLKNVIFLGRVFLTFPILSALVNVSASCIGIKLCGLSFFKNVKRGGKAILFPWLVFAAVAIRGKALYMYIKS
jgi:hypothetical protein